MLLHCAKCGKDLTPVEAGRFISANQPPACLEHLLNVLFEGDNNLPWWPDGWFGHAAMDENGRWYELPSDDGDYDTCADLVDISTNDD